MKFGENTQLVEEVMDFIRNNKMFNNNNFHVYHLWCLTHIHGMRSDVFLDEAIILYSKLHLNPSHTF